ncbi:hypothetical protein [Chryseobacterium sp. JV558]|uniref:hypothetical protein n=1 Tax=Chryseobacterium sp. JV558 TaxID=2663236 RepID=UPI00299EFC24|nr:hypothetical protein [Chryseobacterium sp. JV558]MDW9379950.1 hypothetical protein [Chryseobacterium sp. JV558]
MKYLSIIILLLFINGNAQKMDVKNAPEFIKISKSELKETDLETLELVDFGKIRNQSAPYGDFLSRMYTHFGKPESIMFEGFNYLIRDKQTDIVFLAFFGASGPGYAAKKNNIEKIKPRISELELILDNSKNADCEEEIETDFGIFLCGAKDGIPYDKQKQ